MDEPTPTRRDFPDEMPHQAASDPPLAIENRTPGPRGVGPKIGLAALGILILFAMVAAAWAAHHYSPKRQPSLPSSGREQSL